MSGTTITAFGSGTGGTGTYTVSNSQTVAREAMTASGIPNRTTIYKTLSPSGGDDTSQINTALANCPPGQVLLLTTGVFQVSGNGILAKGSGCTLRGSGPGSQLNTGINPVIDYPYTPTHNQGCTPLPVNATTDQYCRDSSATQIIRTDRASSGNANITVGTQSSPWGISYNLASDAVLGAYSVTLTGTPSPEPAIGSYVWLDEATFDNGGDPNVNWGYSFVADPAQYNQTGYGGRGSYHSISDVYQVASTNGATITFTTPITYPIHTALFAQLTIMSGVLQGIGLENLFVWGGTKGNVMVSGCEYCWAKNIEAVWSSGRNVQVQWGFRDVVRDSFIHETPSPNPGGGGYQMTLEGGTSNSLVENNISWFGNKVNTMELAGGGNVFAYNYTDDSMDADNPDSLEAGINASHMTTPHLNLLEGNYSPNFTGDAYWGNSIYETVFRNWLSAKRAVHPPLNSYYETQSCNGTKMFYADIGNRFAVNLQAYSFYNAFVGNVLGISGQTLAAGDCNVPAQTHWTVQVITSAVWSALGDNPAMWEIGADQNTVNQPGFDNWTFVNSTINTITRTANWDWVTAGESCYDLNAGQGGTTNQGCSGVTVPNSFYLSAKPAFFGTQTWPWVYPTTGTTYTLPAMYCFQHNKMPTCLQ